MIQKLYKRISRIPGATMRPIKEDYKQLTGEIRPKFRDRASDIAAEVPWWGIAILLAGVLLVWNFLTDETYNNIISSLVVGVRLTVTVTLTAYFFAIILGLTTALGQLSDNTFLRNIAQLYVQVIRGVPILVQIFYWGIVIFPVFLVPAVRNLGTYLAENGVLGPENALITWKVDLIYRGIVALAFSYGAFSSEIFRAGIQSIEKGQREAAMALGLNGFQVFRFVILPQAFRRILPPLGNDFIAMLKESSLVSVLGVGEITQLGKKYAAASFLFPETYNTVAFLYLSMTLLLSLGVRSMERRFKSNRQKD
jgi:polar amino acid transport system permease protein